MPEAVVETPVESVVWGSVVTIVVAIVVDAAESLVEAAVETVVVLVVVVVALVAMRYLKVKWVKEAGERELSHAFADCFKILELAFHAPGVLSFYTSRFSFHLA